MKYLLQIYPDADEFAGLSMREQEAIVDEYLAIRQRKRPSSDRV
jgi:hypothetical protein